MSDSAPLPPARALPLPAVVPWPSDERRRAFEAFASALPAPYDALDWRTLAPASADASFRRYLRVHAADGASFIVMDAPPPLEDVRPFVHVAGLVERAGLHAPRVLAADAAHGFLLLTDLGSALYLDALRDPAQADRLMRDALAALVRWQQRVPADALRGYGEAELRADLALFPEWCVARAHGITWNDAQQRNWARVVDALVASACAQPQLAIHADWMPRNLMVCPGQNPGILDFQDAARGPLTHDVASLLRDAFISWDEAQELDWAVRWWEAARAAGGLLGERFEADFAACWQAIEWMGLARHLRVMGIFCRLAIRDGKPRYMQDLPRFFGYATRVAMRYRELAPLLALLEPMSGDRLEAGFTF